MERTKRLSKPSAVDVQIEQVKAPDADERLRRAFDLVLRASGRAEGKQADDARHEEAEHAT